MKKSDLLKKILPLTRGSRRGFNWLLDFIWPQFCLGCKREGNLCCGYCLNNILLKQPEKITWSDKPQTSFEACYICCDYHDELLQKLIKSYKYNYLQNMADVLVTILEKQARRLALPRNTIITNVPLHKRKLKQRGFDQTDILAKKLAKKLDLTYTPLLKRIKHTKAQAQLDKQARSKNLDNAFVAIKQNQKNTVLLIDDVTTTGATLDAAAQALKTAGIARVICLTIAKN
jgi:competence protein ComFC